MSFVLLVALPLLAALRGAHGAAGAGAAEGWPGAVLLAGPCAFFGLLAALESRRRGKWFAAARRLRLATAVFENAREGIMITAADGTIREVNDAFSRITGYRRDEVIGSNPRLLSSGRQGAEFYQTMWRALAENGSWSGEVWNRRKDGQVYAQMETISAVRDRHGAVHEYVSVFSDITPLKEHQGQLEYITHYDALTRLPNRVLLADRLNQAMVQVRRRKQQLAVAFLDLDAFKAINDLHGHEAGDRLLIAVADQLAAVLREGDTLARLGGDEFVAVLLDLPEATHTVQMLNRLLSAASQSLRFGDTVLAVSASLGVTFYPQREDVDADQLLRQADQAMYQAKLAGKNRYHVFDAEHDRNLRGHYESVGRIKLAMNAQEFVLHFQPKVNMRSGTVVGAEALIRWQHPRRGLLLPAEFLPAIADHPLAVELGSWVVDRALAAVELWRSEGNPMPVSVNVGAHELQQADFVPRLQAILSAHPPLHPGDLQLEVLETSALEDIAQVSRIIESCRALGVTFSLDDFGTGYSSLTYLKRLPVTQLKIDQSFVRDMLEDPDDLAILEGVIGLASTFNRQVIAEGVENIETGAMLLQLGCELAQGFAIGRPMPAHEVAAWARQWKTDPSWLGRSPVSRDDLPLLFASVEHRAWIKTLENHLRGAGADPPPLDHHQCRFGIWLDGNGVDRYGGLPELSEIARLHPQIHVLGAWMLQARSQGEDALSRIGELHRLRDEMLGQLAGITLARRP